MIIPEAVSQRAFDRWAWNYNGCRVSTYSTGSHGYAQIGWHEKGRTRMTLAHRAAWTHVYGQIPGGMTVDHLPTCDRRCVHVPHLRLLTNFDNARRQGRDWPLGECSRGHPDSNLVEMSGRMRCYLCRLEDQAKYNAKRRAG